MADTFVKNPTGGYVNTEFAPPSLKGGTVYTAEQAGIKTAPTTTPTSTPSTPSGSSTTTPATTTSPQSATASSPAPTGPTPTTAPLISSATPSKADTTYSSATSNLLPADTPKEEQFFAKIWSTLQPVIDSINKTEYAAEMGAGRVAGKRTSAQNFAMNARGLAGSSEASSMAADIEGERQQTIAQARAEQAGKVADLTKWAIPEAHSQYMDALTRNDKQSADYIANQKAKAQNSLKGIAESGVSLDDFQKNHPDQYSNLLQYYDGDTNSMKADYIASIPAPNIGDPIKAGSQLIYTYVDPITRQVKTTSIDTGTNLTNDTKVIKSADGGLVLYNSRTGEFKELGGGNPYYMANQAALLAARNAAITRSYATTVNSITRQIFPVAATNPINLYSNALNYTTKLNEAHKLATDKNNPEKGPADLELIDSAVKINNGGGIVTETQVNALFRSASIKAKATIEGGKVVGISGLLTDAQRNAIKELAEGNIKAQQKNAINATKVIADKAIRGHVPKEAVTTPEDIMALYAAGNEPQGGQGLSQDILNSIMADNPGMTAEQIQADYEAQNQ